MKAFKHPEVARMSRIIRRRRTALGWSRSKLAGKAGVSLESIENIEGLKRSPQFGLILRIMDALAVRLVPELGPEPCKPTAAMRASLRYAAEWGPVA